MSLRHAVVHYLCDASPSALSNDCLMVTLSIYHGFNLSTFI